MTSERSLVLMLLSRRDRISIRQGELFIEPASGKPVPEDWLNKHKGQMLEEISQVCDIEILTYQSYTTGRYTKSSAGGLTLQLETAGGQPAYVIFNVELHRQRSSRHGAAGTPLPEGQFRVRKKHELYRFWRSTGLNMPPRLSSFHDYLGNLKRVLLTGERTGKRERFLSASLRPLDLTYEHLLAAFRTAHEADNCHTSAGQLPDNCRTRLPYKESPETHMGQGSQRFSSAGGIIHGKKEQGDAVVRGNVYPFSSKARPQDQSVEEWLGEYSDASIP